MTLDESAIHDLVRTWLTASKAGDLQTVLSLMSDDVLFTVPGREPFGKEAFTAASASAAGQNFDGTSEIVELSVHGDWAWMRNRIRVTFTPPGGSAMTRSGYTLSILRKTGEGKWVIVRDANLLGPPAKREQIQEH